MLSYTDAPWIIVKRNLEDTKTFEMVVFVGMWQNYSGFVHSTSEQFNIKHRSCRLLPFFCHSPMRISGERGNILLEGY